MRRAALSLARFSSLLGHQAGSGSLPAVQAVACALLPSASQGFATNSHDIFNMHVNSPENNPSTQFDFTEANYEKVAELLSKYPTNYKQSAVIPMLDLAQQQNGGYLSLSAMNRVAKILDMAEIRVYEVATFYTMFNRSKMGKYHVMVCGTTPCMLQGAKGIYKALKDHLGIDYGQTTADGMFTLGEMECMGACVNAPMIAIADYTKGVEGFSYTYYEDLTPEDTLGIIETIKKGGKPKPGSQHRKKAEPAGAVANGKWVASKPGADGITLTGEPRGPYCRNLDEPEPAPINPAAAGAAPPPPPPTPAAGTAAAKADAPGASKPAAAADPSKAPEKPAPKK
ncbi:hypothetical protein N2152v2_010927 [Parachlorella kessleri]